MLRGGAASRGYGGLLLGVLLATPACGLIVGFEARECEECGDPEGGSGGIEAGGAGGGAETSVGGSELSAANVGGATSGALAASGSGGSQGGSGGSGTTADGGAETANSGGDTSAAGGDGGMGAGGTETVSSTDAGTNAGDSGDTSAAGGDGGMGSGGTETVSGTGGANTGGDGGAGDTSTTTTTSAAGGSAGVGGSGGAGGSSGSGGNAGSGGTGGAPSPCTVARHLDLPDTGIYSAHLMLGRNNAARPWDVSWVDGDDDVYFAAYNASLGEVLAPHAIDDSGAHSASVVATQTQYAFVAYGELDGSDASIVMNRVNPGTGDLTQDSTQLDGATAPDVMGIAVKGTSTDTLVAAVDADEAGELALFSNGEYQRSEAVPGPLTAIAPLDLETSFAVAFIQDGTLQVALLAHDLLTGIETPQEIPSAAPTTTSERSLAGTSFDDGAALVWVEDDGIRLTTINASGAPADVVRVSDGENDVLPMVDSWGNQLVVSWINTDTGTLYVKRFPTGLSDSSEPPLAVTEGVAEVRYGLAADSFSTKPTFGFVFAALHLEVAIVTCPAPNPSTP